MRIYYRQKHLFLPLAQHNPSAPLPMILWAISMAVVELLVERLDLDYIHFYQLFNILVHPRPPHKHSRNTLRVILDIPGWPPCSSTNTHALPGGFPHNMHPSFSDNSVLVFDILVFRHFGWPTLKYVSLVPRHTLAAADGLHHCYARSLSCSGDVIHPQLRVLVWNET